MEAPPAKGVVLAVSFLSLFAILVGLMPSGFLQGGEADQYRIHKYPEYFDGIELSDYATTYMINITHGWFTEAWGMDEGFGHDLYFTANTYYYRMSNMHTFPFWIFYLNSYHRQEWRNHNGTNRGEWLEWDEILMDYVNETAPYTVFCKDFSMKAWVGYNTTLYGEDIKDAWDNDDLRVLFAIEADEIGRTHALSAWSIIGMLLFFQMPDVHPIVNAIIAIPIWALIAVLVFQFIISVIKALPLT